jgi:hypothetical protein
MTNVAYVKMGCAVFSIGAKIGKIGISLGQAVFAFLDTRQQNPAFIYRIADTTSGEVTFVGALECNKAFNIPAAKFPQNLSNLNCSFSLESLAGWGLNKMKFELEEPHSGAKLYSVDRMIETHGLSPGTTSIRGKLEKMDFNTRFAGLPPRLYGDIWEDLMEMKRP